MRIREKVYDWFVDMFGTKSTVQIKEVQYSRNMCYMYFTELAIARATSIIASSISKCEFKTFINNVSMKGTDYYDWNIRPNENQNASEFKYKLIEKLLKNGEALVIKSDVGSYFVADDYIKNDLQSLYGYTFTNVTIGNYQYLRTFEIEDVLFYRLENENLRRLLDNLMQTYVDIMGHAIETYKLSSTQRFKIKLDATRTANEIWQTKIDELMQTQMKEFINKEKSVVPQYDGMEIEEFGNLKTTISFSEIKEIKNDVFETAASALKIPIQLINGSITNLDDVQDQLISLAIEPITKMISEVNTHSLYGVEDWKTGCWFEVDTSKIKYFNLFKLATNIEKLISSGFMCIDEVREEAGMICLGTKFGKMHFMTKNFSSVKELLDSMEVEKGGNECG